MGTVHTIRSTAKCPHCPALSPIRSEEKQKEYLEHVRNCEPNFALLDKRVDNFTRLAEEMNNHPDYRKSLLVCTRCYDFRHIFGSIGGLACKCGGLMLRERDVVENIDGVPVPVF